MTMRFNIISFVLLNIFIQQSLTHAPPVVPLTNALTAVYCHNSDEPGVMTIRCGPNEKIRMLDAFDATAKHRSRLPIQCVKSKQNQYATESDEKQNAVDCKVHTSFTSACTGRENCTLHMQRIRLNSVQDNCHNELVDYTMAFFECISDVFIHDVCSAQAITSAWGTLQTPNFPNPYTSSDDCWCKLSTQLQHRLLLSVIVFQLIPYDKNCAGAGLYLQSSHEQRSTQCTYLQQGHNYLSDTNQLYMNFYSRTPTVRGGFWIVYEASHPNAEVHLQCGPRSKIGVPISSNSHALPSISTPFDHGWSRLAFNSPPNSTATLKSSIKRTRWTTATPSTFIHANSKISASTPAGAFTYPHGALTTFELAYGPSGWYLKHPINLLPKTTKRLPITTAPSTSSQFSIPKWNFTSHYTQPSRKNISITTPVSTTSKLLTMLPSTSFSSTSTTQTITAEQRLLFTHTPWVYYSSTSSPAVFTIATTEKPVSKTTINSVSSTSITKATLPLPTPWYSPAGPYDWWQWYGQTKRTKSSSTIFSYPKQTSTTTEYKTTSTSRRTSPLVTNISIMTPRATLASTAKFFAYPVTSTTERTTVRTTTSKSTNTHTTSQTSTSTKEDLSKWLRWPEKIADSNKKEEIDDFAEEYKDWFDSMKVDHMEEVSTSTVPVNIFVTLPSQQENSHVDFMSTKPNWRVVTINTPPSKRHHAQNNYGHSERNSIGSKDNEQTTPSNVHNMIRRVIEQRNKKNSTEYGWLSKTDMTIVAVSILFVILLAIFNLILFAVRRHRHRIQGRHLLSTSIPSTLENRKHSDSGRLRSPTLTNASNGSNNPSNNDGNNDILPAVGEIVIWDEKDQGGYMIDNDGAWAKIEGRQWFGSQIFKTCTKTPLAKSFRSRFRFIRHLDRKSNNNQQQSPITPKKHPIQQPTFKFPLLMDAATLSPVPEADDYESSELSLSDVIIRSSAATLNNSNRRQQQPLIRSNRRHDLTPQNQQQQQQQQQQQASQMIQALIHSEPEHNDDYYKRTSINIEESNYTALPGNFVRNSYIFDQETDRSAGNEVDTGGPIIVSVPTIVRQDDDVGTVTDGAESIYNPNYSIHSLNEYQHRSFSQQHNNTGPFCTKPSISTFKPAMNHSLVVGYCQTEFQPLDPKLLFKSADKASLIERQQMYRSTQTAPLSTCDSGFADEPTNESLTVLPDSSTCETNLNNKRRQERMSMDDILLTKSEEDEDVPLNDTRTDEIEGSDQSKWKNMSKRVSFQEQHVTQRFSPPPPPPSFYTMTNPETSSTPFDTYDIEHDAIPSVPVAPPLKSFLSASAVEAFNDNSATTSSLFTLQKHMTSIDNEDNAESIIMNHLHSVQSLKKFFEKKMVLQRPMPSVQTIMCPSSTTTNNEQKRNPLLTSKEQPTTDEFDQRQEMMNKVLYSLKKKKIYSRTTNDIPDFTGRCSEMTTSSYDSNAVQSASAQPHYSRRFRSSSTSNNSLGPASNTITHINPTSSHFNKRAYSQDRQHYQTTDHHFSNVEKWKQEQQRHADSDDDDNISENSMLWQARTKLNQFVTRNRKHQQQSPYYASCTNARPPSEDLYIYDDNDSVTAETRF